MNNSEDEHLPWWDLLLAGRNEGFLSLLHVDPKVYEKIGEFTKNDKTAVGTKQKESAEQTRQKVPLCR